MPSKKGMIEDQPCEYPIGNFKNNDPQKGFIGLIQYLFTHFAKGPKYISLEKWERKEKRRSIWKNTKFVDLPSKKKI